MLRDVLTRVPGLTTWPCDEINLVWRHGNRDHPSDELPASAATPEVAASIRRAFERLGARNGGATVVEKTCANTLRVGFVDRVVPDARYIYIERDGIDAAASAMQRWHAPFDFRYTAAKARYVPASDLPFYATRFVSNRLRARGGDAAGGAQVSSWWGPKLDGQADLIRRHSLDELCAIQWQRCVQNAERDLADIDPARIHRVRYEHYVRTPAEDTAAILDFLGISGAVDARWHADVSAHSVGKGRAQLPVESLARMTALVGATLEHTPMVTEPTTGLTRRQRTVKRALDLAVAIPLVILTTPLLLICVATARLSAGGSGLYRQARIGRDGVEFDVWKIRTMLASADPTTTVTVAGDSRITRVGRFLRASKFDELPQLINVIRGDMSLVGPRPDVPGFADRLTGDDRIILSVRPGITGPASIAFRDEESLLSSVVDAERYNRDVVWPQKVKLNREYVETWTLIGDVRWMAATVRRNRAPLEFQSTTPSSRGESRVARKTVGTALAVFAMLAVTSAAAYAANTHVRHFVDTILHVHHRGKAERPTPSSVITEDRAAEMIQGLPSAKSAALANMARRTASEGAIHVRSVVPTRPGAAVATPSVSRDAAETGADTTAAGGTSIDAASDGPAEGADVAAG